MKAAETLIAEGMPERILELHKMHEVRAGRDGRTDGESLLVPRVSFVFLLPSAFTHTKATLSSPV